MVIRYQLFVNCVSNHFRGWPATSYIRPELMSKAAESKPLPRITNNQ